MENQKKINSASTNQNNQSLPVQDEHLQNLEILLTSLAGEDVAELTKNSPSMWQHLEELEQQVWATLFPASPPYFAAEHRMTMSRL